MNEEVQDVVEPTENDEAQASEETVEGVELTDTAETENVEEKEEEPKGRYMTDEEINSIVDRRVKRKMEKYEREMNVYKDTANVVKQAVGGEDINEINHNLRTFYENEGYKLPEKTSSLTTREIEVLARAEADDIIEDGYDAMVEEANRLAKIGYDNMSERERVIFNTLGDKLTEENDKKGLLKIGAKEDVLKEEEFKKFRNQFKTNTPIEYIYDLYKKENKKTVKENPGSMKNSEVNSSKDYYTPEEIAKLSDEQLDDPKIWEVVRKSMTKDNPTNYYE